MPIQHAIWKIGAMPEALTASEFATEKDLENMITARPEMISSDWRLICPGKGRKNCDRKSQRL